MNCTQCDKPVIAKGLCSKHYQRMKKSDAKMRIDGPVMAFAKTYGIEKDRYIALVQMIMEGETYENISKELGYHSNSLAQAVYQICKLADVNNGRDGICALVYQMALGYDNQSTEIVYRKVRRETAC